MARKRGKALLEKLLDKAWSEYVRKSGGVCQKCKASGVWVDKYGNERSSLQAHHAFGRRHRATRWDIANGVCLCHPCHLRWAHRDSGGFTVWFRQHVGEEQFERLAEAHNQVVKHTTEDLERMLKDINEMAESL